MRIVDDAVPKTRPSSKIGSVFGHFHRAVITHWNDILFINPGAVSAVHGESSFTMLELGETATAGIVPLGKQQTN